MKTKIVKPLLSGLGLALLSSQAFADGIPAASLKDAPIVAIAPTWTGFYGGGSIGYGWNDSKNNYRDSDGERSSVSEDADGGLVSAIIGYDRQFHDRFVLGAFVDFDYMDVDRGRKGDGLTIDRAFSIGARAGVLVTPRTLLFGTAGYTQAHIDNDGWWDIGGPGFFRPGKDEQDFGGYFVGGGLEHLIGNNLYLRGEVRYSEFDAEITNKGSVFGTDYVDKEKPELVTARLGVVYKLGRGDVAHGEGLKDGGGSGTGTLGAASYYGVDVAKDVWAVYSGGVYAFNGDLTRNGFVARTFGWYADYSYKSDDEKFNGEDRALDAMLGYQHYFGDLSAIAYVGMEVRDIDQKPEDFNNKLRGTEAGFKVALELETEGDGPLYANLDASYSTAFDSFYAMLRLGHNAKRFKVGPEGQIISEEGEVTSRLGGFVAIPFDVRGMPAEISFNGGYQFVEDNDNGSGDDAGSTRGGEGGYFGSMFKVVF